MKTVALTRMLSARVTADLYKRVQVYRATNDLSVQAFITAAITEYLDRHEKRTDKR